MAEDDDDREALLTALTTEHFVQSTLSGISTSEASTRTSLYLLTLSTSMVALGFAGLDSPSFLPLASIVLPVLSVVGCFTEERLVSTAIQNVAAITRIARIRNYYAGLHPRAPTFFGSADQPDVMSQTTGVLGVAGGWRASLPTMATMVAVVNSVVIGAAVACVSELADLAHRAAVAVGVAAAIVHLAVFLVAQQRRFARHAAS